MKGARESSTDTSHTNNIGGLEGAVGYVRKAALQRYTPEGRRELNALACVSDASELFAF